MVFDIEMIKKMYANMTSRVDAAVVARPRTCWKILYSHLWDGQAWQAYGRGVDYVVYFRWVVGSTK
jgi:aconitate hydratase